MARKLFQAKIKHARFVVGPFRPEEMATLAGILRDSVRSRIQSGINVGDLPARALSPLYLKTKVKRGGQASRDWTMSGNTIRAMAVLEASENRATIGFNNPIAARVARWNNLRERQFGVSPTDQRVIVAAVTAQARQSRVISVRRSAA